MYGGRRCLQMNWRRQLVPLVLNSRRARAWGITWSDFLILVSSLMLRAKTCLRGLRVRRLRLSVAEKGQRPRLRLRRQASRRLTDSAACSPKWMNGKLAFKVIRNLLHIVTTTLTPSRPTRYLALPDNPRSAIPIDYRFAASFLSAVEAGCNSLARNCSTGAL